MRPIRDLDRTQREVYGMPAGIGRLFCRSQ